MVSVHERTSVHLADAECYSALMHIHSLERRFMEAARSPLLSAETAALTCHSHVHDCFGYVHVWCVQVLTYLAALSA